MKYHTSTTQFNCGIDLHARQITGATAPPVCVGLARWDGRAYPTGHGRDSVDLIGHIANGQHRGGFDRRGASWISLSDLV